MNGGEVTVARRELTRLLADVLEPTRRAAAIAQLSAVLGIETFVIFVRDPDLGKLLAAPGFPQTFPDRKAWHAFLNATQGRGERRTSLPWPEPNQLMPATGVRISDAGVVALLGGAPEPEQVEEFAELLQLVVPGLIGEMRVASSAVQLQLAHQASCESATLAASLDEARRAAQAEVAARKRAEAELRQARDDLARANVELEDRVRERTEELRETIGELEAFSYTVSHDLRAPLRAIYNYADALIEDVADKLEPEERAHLLSISRAAHRLDGMIGDVLRYSRMSRAEIALHPVPLERIVREVIGEFTVLHAIEDCIRIEPPLPIVIGHEVLLAQCISNLLLNAVKFVAPGVTPRIRIYAEDRGTWARLWIEDNGIGIAPEHVGRLFGMFERINPAAGFEGNGIGLAIVKRAVTRLGGDVGVESVPNEGSRFWLNLPRVNAAGVVGQ